MAKKKRSVKSKETNKNNNTSVFSNNTFSSYEDKDSLFYTYNPEDDPAFIEKTSDGKNNHYSYSKTGRCHCNGYLWFIRSLGKYKCGDCRDIYDKVILDPDLIEEDDEDEENNLDSFE